MRRRIVLQVLLGMGLLIFFMILTAPKAFADNCGSLNDCFQVEGAAASVTAGVAVIITIAVLALPSLLDHTRSTHTPMGTRGGDAPEGPGERDPMPPPHWPSVPPIPPVIP